MAVSKSRKSEIFNQFSELVEAHTKVISVDCTNVPSSSLALTRRLLRDADIPLLFGKNTYLRAALKDKKGAFNEGITSLLRGNVGVCFVKDNLARAYELLTQISTPATAKAGTFASKDVTIEARVTNISPGQTAFFQSLAIPTKITKGNIEIIGDVELLKEGDLINSNHAAILKLLNITPFTFKLKPVAVCDNGNVFDAQVLAVSAESMMDLVKAQASRLTCISLGAGVFNRASAPHVLRKSYMDMLALALACDVSDPRVSAALAAGAANAQSSGPAPIEAAVEVVAEDEPVEYDDLFG